MSYFIYANITLITRVTWRVRVPLVEQELLTLPEYLSSLQLFCGFRVACSFVFWIVFCRSLFFLLAIVFSVLLPIVASDDSFGIFKCDKMANKNTTPSEHFPNLGERDKIDTVTHNYMIVHFSGLIQFKTINNCEKDTQIFCSVDRTRVQEQIAKR